MGKVQSMASPLTQNKTTPPMARIHVSMYFSYPHHADEESRRMETIRRVDGMSIKHISFRGICGEDGGRDCACGIARVATRRVDGERDGVLC